MESKLNFIVVSDEKMYVNLDRQVGGRQTECTTDGRRTPESLLYHYLTDKSLAQVSENISLKCFCNFYMLLHSHEKY